MYNNVSEGKRISANFKVYDVKNNVKHSKHSKGLNISFYDAKISLLQLHVHQCNVICVDYMYIVVSFAIGPHASTIGK